MATSGTTDFSLSLDEIIEEAFERAGRQASTGYDFRTARRSLNLLFLDWANRGYNLWTVDPEEETLVASTAEYTLPADTIDIVDAVLRTTSGGENTDQTLGRMHLNTYTRITNKELESVPTRFYIKREVDAPKIVLWPVPDSATTYTLVYWRMRRIEDAGTATNTPDVPFRFLPALIAGLAFYVAQKIPEGRDSIQRLEMAYESAWSQAAAEDRDRSSVFIRPRIS